MAINRASEFQVSMAKLEAGIRNSSSDDIMKSKGYSVAYRDSSGNTPGIGVESSARQLGSIIDSRGNYANQLDAGLNAKGFSKVYEK